MKRRLLLVAVFLLAGAVVNVAVAWGCRLAVRGPPRFSPAYQPSDASTTAWWNENKPEGVTDELAGFLIIKRFGWTRDILHGDEGGIFRILPSGNIRITGQMQDVHMVMRVTAGLPMRSLLGHSWSRKGAMIQQSGIITTRRWLPYLPMWPGFIVNTLLYAVVLWLLSGGYFRLRRFIRVRRGLCPACAYPRGESDVCSECGKALREPAQ